MTLPWTLALLVAGLALAASPAGMKRGRASSARCVCSRSTLLLAIGVISAVLAAAHLVSLLTGHPAGGALQRHEQGSGLAELRLDGSIQQGL